MQILTADEARALAEEAYTYGFAIVENYKAIFGMCVFKDSPQFSGFNNYLHGRQLFDPDYDVVVTPNNDTLYSTTFADLRSTYVFNNGNMHHWTGLNGTADDPSLPTKEEWRAMSGAQKREYWLDLRRAWNKEWDPVRRTFYSTTARF